MIAVTHNNALLESFHVQDLGYDPSNLDLSSVGIAVLEQYEQLSKEIDHQLFIDNVVSPTVDNVLEKEIANGDGEEPFYVGDMGIVVRQYQKWTHLLPRIEPFYAVKCNTDEMLLNTLEKLGTGFDCASKAEIKCMLDKGVPPSKIIYANPCKPASHIRYAREVGVKRMTFDNLTELVKIKREFPEAELVLRIVTDDSNSICRFSVKFGAAIDMVESLLIAAKTLGLEVVGVSFHVGSGCCDAAQYMDALKNARYVFDKAQEVGFSQFHLLDIGGGYPGCDEDDHVVVTFPQIASVVNQGLDFYFPHALFPQLRVIAEPGRFFASAAYVLAVSITSCRVVGDRTTNKKKFMYYVNDGVYGSFNCLLFDHAVVQPEVITQHGRFLSKSAVPVTETFSCSMWGPTCDSMDCIMKDSELPEMDVGDWFAFRNMGAYTMAAASTFNGFPRSRVTYINEEAWRLGTAAPAH